jgi:hydroxyacylglutathione hydrolase
MIFRPIKSEGLAHLSYFIGSGPEALVIDPRRDVQEYMEIAGMNCMRIVHVLETHRNEDIVTGSPELKELTGCSILHGRSLPFKYGEGVGEGDSIRLGNLRIKALETPGHTAESMTYVLYDNDNPVPLMAFTGDTIFAGSTARTDLWGTKEQASGALYDSIKNKILTLGDQVILCPAHGAGSACGVGISDRGTSTLGYERLTNPDLQLSKEEFIAKKKGELLETPYYFERMEAINLNGAALKGGPACPVPMHGKDFEKVIGTGILFDTRMPASFFAHIPGSYSIWLDGMATFTGWIGDDENPVYLLTERDEDVEIATKYLYRLGIDNVKGYLCGGFQAWLNGGYDTEFMGAIVPDALAGMLSSNKVTLLDVRSEHEWREGRIKEAVHIYVGELERRIGEVPSGKPIACICSTGLRASLAASILKRAGFGEVYNVLGGVTAWKERDYPLLYERMLEK